MRLMTDLLLFDSAAFAAVIRIGLIFSISAIRAAEDLEKPLMSSASNCTVSDGLQLAACSITGGLVAIEVGLHFFGVIT